MKSAKENILDFWFVQTQPAQWFQVSEEFDETIKEQFEESYNLASDGVYDDWKNDADGALALVILMDQMPRNMFR